MKNIKTLLLEDAAFYDAQMGQIKLGLWAEQLSDLTPNEVERAMKYFRGEKGRRDMPRPADLRSYLKPPEDDDSLAKEAAARIVHALVKYGYTGGKEAKDFIGEIGWAVVSKQGGWVHICENWRVDQVPSLQAQWRDLARVQIQRARAGNLDVAPMLPQGSANESAAKLLVSNLAKQKQMEST